jgi:hypothetical protein
MKYINVDETGFSGNGDITREFTVWCGLCSEWHQESAKNQTIAIKIFRRSGWIKTKEHGWICSKHIGK